MKHFIVSILFFLKTGTVCAIPLCAPQKFHFSMKNVVSSLAVTQSDNNKVFFAVDIKEESDVNYVGRLVVFDDKCNTKYLQKLDYYPISIFILDDGVSGVVFNLTQSGDGSYILYAYYLSGAGFTKVIDGAASNPLRPVFMNAPNSSAPIVKTYNRFSSVCETYEFNEKHMQYFKFKSDGMCKF